MRRAVRRVLGTLLAMGVASPVVSGRLRASGRADDKGTRRLTASSWHLVCQVRARLSPAVCSTVLVRSSR
jgi:hypothetical protein